MTEPKYQIRAVGGARAELPTVDPEVLAILEQQADARHSPAAAHAAIVAIHKKPRPFCKVDRRKRIALHLALRGVNLGPPVFESGPTGKRGRPSSRTQYEALIDEIELLVDKRWRDTLRGRRKGVKAAGREAELKRVAVRQAALVLASRRGRVNGRTIHEHLHKMRREGLYRGPIPGEKAIREMLAEFRGEGFIPE